MGVEQNSKHQGLSNLSSDTREVEKYYDDWADDYDRDLETWRYQAPERAAKILRRYLEPDSVILDAGCGTGMTGKALANEGFTVFDGIDLSERSIEAAAVQGVYRSLNRANMQELPLPIEDDKYDGLECIGVLTYIPESEDLLREFCRIVRPGGFVVLTQRTDTFVERDFSSVLKTIASEGSWRLLEVTNPQPYLPANEEYADEIMIHYIICQVV